MWKQTGEISDQVPPGGGGEDQTETGNLKCRERIYRCGGFGDRDAALRDCVEGNPGLETDTRY